MILKNKRILVVLRHENSLNIARSFVEGCGGVMAGVTLDAIELSEQVPEAMEKIREEVQSADAIVLGTKVYDDDKNGPSRLFDLLDFLDKYGVGEKPILLTHLYDMPEDMKAGLCRRANLGWVENDNLKRDGMKNLGPLILRAFDSAPKDFRPPIPG
jgi:hypothetical protein